METQPFLPTILLPEIFSPHKHERGFLARVIEDIALDDFYKAVEIGTIEDKEDRKRILTASQKAGLTVTQWMTDLITESDLDLSSPVRSERNKGISHIKNSMYLATESGAENIALVSGPNYTDRNKEDSIEAFYESLCEICSEASKYNMKVLVEPLDRYAHKKKFMGPSNDLMTLMKRVKESKKNIGVAFDTAHSALNSESIEDSLELLNPFVEQIHLSNAVLDPEDPLYGDNHMPIGKPGFLHKESIYNFIKVAEDLDLIGKKQTRLSVEVRTSPNEDAFETAKNAKQLLKNILEQITERV